MNFKIIFLLLISISVVGCGVKAKPAFPPDTAVQNYINHYTDQNLNTATDTKSEVKK